MACKRRIKEKRGPTIEKYGTAREQWIAGTGDLPRLVEVVARGSLASRRAAYRGLYRGMHRPNQINLPLQPHATVVGSFVSFLLLHNLLPISFSFSFHKAPSQSGTGTLRWQGNVSRSVCSICSDRVSPKSYLTVLPGCCFFFSFLVTFHLVKWRRRRRRSKKFCP